MAAKNKGPGRPPGPTGKAKDVTIRQRVTVAEKKELEQASLEAGESLSRFMVVAALRRARAKSTRKKQEPRDRSAPGADPDQTPFGRTNPEAGSR